MSQDMSSSSWRSLAYSAGSSLKSYVSRPDRQGWKQWAGQKIRNTRRTSSDPNTEVMHVFPGWAVRRYAPSTEIAGDSPRPFQVEVVISGYAISHKPLEQTSRSQRAFIRLAKGFAALPKLVDVPGATVGSLSSTEQLVANLPPRPSEIDDLDMEELERQLQRAKNASSATHGTHTTRHSVSGSVTPGSTEPGGSAFPSDSESSSASSSTQDLPSTIDITGSHLATDALRSLHANLEKRLQPFWSSVLPNRIVHLKLYASPHRDPSTSDSTSSNSSNSTSAFAVPLSPNSSSFNATLQSHGIDTPEDPLATTIVATGTDGSFSAKFIIQWERLCSHPLALHIAFGEQVVEHDLFVIAELTPAPQSSSRCSSPKLDRPGDDYFTSSRPEGYNTYRPRHLFSHSVASPSVMSTSLLGVPPSGASGSSPLTPIPVPPSPPSVLIRIPISYSPIRLISDIDDTVKNSGVINGAKAVFRNVFVNEMKESVIPGMGKWYMGMWERGVRFHYVSNGPFEMITILSEFFQLSELPPGSIKLKSYAGRSLLSGLLSAPAARKRANLLELLDGFGDDRFLLVGDSGEQDLELYAEVSKERPEQIAGVYIRDVGTDYDPIDDPTGDCLFRKKDVIGSSSMPPIVDMPLTQSPTSSMTASSRTSSSPNPKVKAKAKEAENLIDFQVDTETLPAYSGTSTSQNELADETPRATYIPSFPSPSLGSGSLGLDSYQTPDIISDTRMYAQPSLSLDFTSTPSRPSPLPLSPQLSPSRSKTHPPPPRHPSSPESRTGSSIPSTRSPLTTRPSYSQYQPSRSQYINQPPAPIAPLSFVSNSNIPPPRFSPTTRTNNGPPGTWHPNGSMSSLLSNQSSNGGKGTHASLSDADKSRSELQMRVWKARALMPRNVPLRVFRDPLKECVPDVEKVLGTKLDIGD